MIPKLIYATWKDAEHLPEHDCYVDTWREKLPDYEIRILTDDDIPSSPCTDAMLAKGKPVNAAQYACWQQLYKTGGVYFDLDVDVLRSFDDLLVHDAFLGIEADHGPSYWAACGVIGAVAGHPFIKECLEYMDSFDYDHPKVENELGPRMFTKLLLQHGWKRTDADATVAGVRILNSKRFYPYSWQDVYTPECVTSDTYAVHRWAHTWNPARNEPVSVVIPCFNQSQYLADAIDSALAQTVPPLEVIVVDDASTTGDVLAVVSRYDSSVVRLITRERNGGASAARNTGIAAARGEWITMLDADDMLRPRFIEKLIGLNDVVSPALQVFGNGRDDKWFPGMLHPTAKDFMVANRAICGSLFRRVWWEKVGGLDENMRHGYEDWDFWTRVAHAGAGFTCRDEVLFDYRRYPEDRTGTHGSLEHARAHDGEIRAYMQSKYFMQGILAVARPPIRYPVPLAKAVEFKGRTYAKGEKIDRDTAVAMKRAGLLSDPRIV